MAKDTFYFSHDYNARSDKEMIKVRMKMGMEGIGLYWCIVEMLYEENGYLLRNEYERISFELRTDVNRITLLIETFNLFKCDTDRFWSTSVLERLRLRKDKSDKARDSIMQRWDTNVLKSNADRNTIKERKGKERKEKRGIRFSADGRKVFFDDDSSQDLGQGQQIRFKEGGFQPHYIKKGIIE